MQSFIYSAGRRCLSAALGSFGSQRTLLLAGGVAACFAASSPGTARGAVAGDYLGGGTAQTFTNATGYFFTPNTSITVTDLGYFDYGTPGLTDPHDVGIFLASNGSPLATTTVPAGVAAAYVPNSVYGTRFVPITPIVLAANTQYYIEANNNTTDLYVYGTGAVAYAPQITWNGFGDSNSNSISGTVSNNGGLPGNLGPNFTFTVPEPASLGLIGVAGALVAQRRRRD